ncbi:hypothetical protein LshimejAT787_1105180 [Lyophyllum shimeji]|uniref:Uncharacterized protein n=1 Tax=Lyophyllum shimeji TaxID=47721 RepID=A0A9P3URB6_LYOSH|nr:hypothetical protein LshimejAT787_1105180 [Lyophyllum shimeji]
MSSREVRYKGRHGWSIPMKGPHVPSPVKGRSALLLRAHRRRHGLARVLVVCVVPPPPQAARGASGVSL